MRPEPSKSGKYVLEIDLASSVAWQRHRSLSQWTHVRTGTWNALTEVSKSFTGRVPIRNDVRIRPYDDED